MLSNLRRQIANYINPNQTYNKYLAAFLGNEVTNYDDELTTYIDKGYNVNPMVYSIVNQMAQKTAQVPIYVKEIDNKEYKKQLDNLMQSTKGDLNISQFLKYVKLYNKAYSDDEMLPLEKPNVNQTWTEFIALYKTFIRCTGNAYLYCLSPEEGVNAGKPIQMYWLPSHLIQILVKDKVDYLSAEDPVKGYILQYGRQYIEFEAKDVIHIKYSNPNFDQNGEHLYGQSPLKAALSNIQSSNLGLDLNKKTLQNGGAFGLIHSKGGTLTPDQAKSLKERLIQMDNSSDRLSKIAGVSAEVGFTRLSLTSDDLKPFDYFKFDKEQIANCLQWEIMTEGRGDFGGTIQQIRKQRITDNIQPDLKLLADAFNTQLLPRFKGYENKCFVFDCMELPEMQTDVVEVSKWLNDALDRGVINRNEYRQAIQYTEAEGDDMNVYTVSSDVISLEDALDNDFNVQTQ